MTKKDILFAVLCVFLWASNFLVQKLALQEMPLFFYNFLRFFLLVPLIPFFPRIPVKFSHCFLISFFWITLNFLCIGLGLKSGIDVGIASVVFQSSVIFSIFLSIFFLKERINLLQAMGILISFSAIVFLSIGRESTQFMGGEVFILASAMSWALGYTLMKKFRTESNMGLSIWISLLSLPFMALGSTLFEGSLISSFEKISFKGFLYCLYATVFCTVFSTYIWIKLVKKYSSAKVSPFMFLIPCFSCFLGWSFLNERLDISEILTIGIIMIGIFFSSKKESANE